MYFSLRFIWAEIRGRKGEKGVSIWVAFYVSVLCWAAINRLVIVQCSLCRKYVEYPPPLPFLFSAHMVFTVYYMRYVQKGMNELRLNVFERYICFGLHSFHLNNNKHKNLLFFIFFYFNYIVFFSHSYLYLIKYFIITLKT